MAATGLPKTMKAVQVVEFDKPYEIRTIPVPSSLGPNDLLVKIAVASSCHTDSMVQSGAFATRLPCTASHEGSGTVCAVGNSVGASHSVGDRVMCGIPFHPCGRCGDCSPSGPEVQRQYCARVERHCGVTGPGFLAQYAVVDARHATPLPDAVGLESAAPLACAGRTVWRGVDVANLHKGAWIALVGSGGGLGHLGIQFAKGRGLKIVGVDARDEGLALSRESGADVVVDARKGKEEVAREVQGVTGGDGVDASLVLSDAEGAAALACAVTKMHGEVIQIAQPDEVKVPFAELIFRDIRLRGSLLCSEGESKRMLDEVAANGIKVKTNAFHGLDSIKELTKLVHGGKIQGKAVIIVDQEQIDREKELGAAL